MGIAIACSYCECLVLLILAYVVAGHVIRNWKQRWFLLKNDMLYYFRTAEEQAPLGVIPMNGATVTVSHDERGRTICIIPGSSQLSPFYLKSSSEDDHVGWLEVQCYTAGGASSVVSNAVSGFGKGRGVHSAAKAIADEIYTLYHSKGAALPYPAEATAEELKAVGHHSTRRRVHVVRRLVQHIDGRPHGLDAHSYALCAALLLSRLVWSVRCVPGGPFGVGLSRCSGDGIECPDVWTETVSVRVLNIGVVSTYCVSGNCFVILASG